MKKLMKNVIIVSLFCMSILLTSHNVFANDIANSLSQMEYSEEFKQWLELSEEEKQKVFMPRMYDFKSSKIEYKNPLSSIISLGTNYEAKFSLKDVIPNNLKIKNQQQTGSCWAFAGLSSLETNLALSNYKNNVNTSKVYDFSERHMEYSATKTFANNVINPIGYNRNVNEGGNSYYVSSYLTNGAGAIPESEMPFENNVNVIDISAIQNKTVSSQVYDTVFFDNYQKTTGEEKTTIMNKIKQHIKNYGSVSSMIHGSSPKLSFFECVNTDTGAQCCKLSLLHPIDHAISIIGWDDNYSVDNFVKTAKPKANGAWIVRNSWGERVKESLSELKQECYEAEKSYCNKQGWTEPSMIPNEFIEEYGYTIEGNMAYMNVGDNGLFYLSYEDVNIASNMFGIIKATDTVNYNHIYQYDKFFPANAVETKSNEFMLGNIFEKGNSTEYLTSISLYTDDSYTCRVYVNPTGSSFAKSDLTLVPLKAGSSKTLDTLGYHTLEFAKHIPLTGNKFAVVVEITSSSDQPGILLESKMKDGEQWDVVTTETGKCFLTTGHDLSNATWQDLGHLSQSNSSLTDGDSTIKAFTTNELLDGSLKEIKITTPPTKTSYIEGENFDKSGMVVTAYFNSKTNPSAVLDSSNYSITNGTNLKTGQTSVTISYGGKSVNQAITVVENSVTELKIKTPPTKTSYIEGQNFDKSGMVVEATRKNGNKEKVTSYTIQDGTNLTANQTKVTISYGGKSVNQTITVAENSITDLKIKTPPTKTSYIEGQNFDKSGMVVEATRKNGNKETVTSYTIQDGTNLKLNQTNVTISYGGKSVNQTITVVANSITDLKIKTPPTKTSYIEGQNFDKSGMVVEVTKKNGSKETVTNYTVEDGNNLKANQTNVTISYSGKSVNQAITVVEKTATEISINKKPTKLNYTQNKEILDLTGGSIKVTYNDKSTQNIDMKSKEVTATGFDNKNVGKQSITLTYQSKTTSFEIEIVEDTEKAENSNLSNAICNIKNMKTYFFTNNSQEDYALLGIEINNIVKNSNNDKLEYYYYFSGSKDEKNIIDWTKIKEEQNSNDKLNFTINTKDIPNYDEVSKEEFLYLYIKEIAIKGGNQSIAISKSLSLEANVESEIYIDNVKKGSINIGNNNNSNNNNNNNDNGKDTTVSGNTLPKAGVKTLISLIVIVLLISGICYFKYHKLKDVA